MQLEKLFLKRKIQVKLKSKLALFIWIAYAIILNLFFCHSLNQESQTNSSETQSPDFEFPEETEWINTNSPLFMKDLRGKFIVLHFWKYTSIQSLHSIQELKRLERKWSRELILIGIHSPKFSSEKNSKHLANSILRLNIDYPVVNDSELILWKKFSINSWSSYLLIDPNGKIIGSGSGEMNFDNFNYIISRLAKEFKKKNILNQNILKLVKNLNANLENEVLSFPSGIALNEKGNELFVSDSNHNRILRIDTSTKRILAIIGSKEPGLRDGKFSVAKLNNPNGLVYWKENLYIADSGNHCIRVADLKNNSIKTISGTGERAKSFNLAGIGKNISLNSPWDITIFKSNLYSTMRGSNQIWKLNLKSLEIDVLAGSGSENIFDGDFAEASMGQPTGITRDEIRLYFTDSEVSAVRSIGIKSKPEVKTIVGKGLFEFGDIDNKSKKARLQFPMGISYLERNLYISDTLNNKIKRIDLETYESITLAGSGKIGKKNGNLLDSSFFEPSGIAATLDKLYVADTNNHSIREIDLKTNTVSNFEIIIPE